MARLLDLFRGRLKSPLARRLGAVLVLILVILFISNPELLSMVLFVELIGVDVLILLAVMQIKEHWMTISTFIITPCCFRIRRLLGLEKR
ncbi:hypothetical protein I5U42_16830 [Stenotrophomonas maltophilia]|uniref:hypothetical protein n=1 Tax=Stenotrophomonas sp. RAC2 TaxID=3064902 RepID=UPI001311EDBC|nr:hypothetical protein [Stenotrophomonas sp. RAC2]MBH1432960.1 hypothetical protein [Stenotrophomonas maltophilia]MDV9040254.1 hypothetical protein [Stenotrophomonas sp. RAC2]